MYWYINDVICGWVDVCRVWRKCCWCDDCVDEWFRWLLWFLLFVWCLCGCDDWMWFCAIWLMVSMFFLLDCLWVSYVGCLGRPIIYFGVWVVVFVMWMFFCGLCCMFLVVTVFRAVKRFLLFVFCLRVCFCGEDDESCICVWQTVWYFQRKWSWVSFF